MIEGYRCDLLVLVGQALVGLLLDEVCLSCLALTLAIHYSGLSLVARVHFLAGLAFDFS